MTRPSVTSRRLDARSAMRRQIAEQRAQSFVTQLVEDLSGLDSDTAFEVCRAVVRKVAAAMANGTNVARSMGVLAGAATNIDPAYRPDRTEAREVANTAFRKAAA